MSFPFLKVVQMTLGTPKDLLTYFWQADILAHSWMSCTLGPSIDMSYSKRSNGLAAWRCLRLRVVESAKAQGVELQISAERWKLYSHYFALQRLKQPQLGMDRSGYVTPELALKQLRAAYVLALPASTWQTLAAAILLLLAPEQLLLRL